MIISAFFIFYVTTIPFCSCMELLDVCRRHDGDGAEARAMKELGFNIAARRNRAVKNKDHQKSEEGLSIPAETLVPVMRSQLEQDIVGVSSEETAADAKRINKHVVTQSDLANSLQLLLNMVNTAKTGKVSGLKTEIENLKGKNQKTIKPTKTVKKETTTERTTTTKTTTENAIHLRARDTNTVDLMDRIMEDFEKDHKEVSNENSEDVSLYMRATDNLYYDLTEEASGGGLKYKLAHDYI